MNSTTGLSATCWRMRSWVVVSICRSSLLGMRLSLQRFRGRWWRQSGMNSILGRTGLQRQRVQLATHTGPERLINELMLLHAALAAERIGNDMRRVMVSVAAQILDR